MGSLTGAVASKRVTEAYKGRLSMEGNHASSAKAKAGLTVRRTCQTDAKAGLSDPYTSSWERVGLTDKSYPGDNRLILPKRPQRRQGLAPRCRLIVSSR